MNEPGYVYTLLLEDDCYYVGWSAKENIQVRICSHFLGAGTLFTQKYKPIDIIDVKPGDTLLETLTTLKLMCKYGYNSIQKRPVNCQPSFCATNS